MQNKDYYSQLSALGIVGVESYTKKLRIYAHFWLISPYKIPKLKTYGAIAQIKSLKSCNGCFGSSHIKAVGCQVSKKNSIFSYTLLLGLLSCPGQLDS